MKNINKIIKWLMVALIVISVGILIWGFAVDFESNGGTPVDVLLRWAYIMCGLAIGAIVLLGIIMRAVNDPKSLIKLGIVLLGAAAICFVVYLISPGNAALGLSPGMDQPDATTLKLVDTVLNLTYIAGGLAILAIVCGEIWSAIRK